MNGAIFSDPPCITIQFPEVKISEVDDMRWLLLDAAPASSSGTQSLQHAICVRNYRPSHIREPEALSGDIVGVESDIPWPRDWLLGHGRRTRGDE